MKKYCFIAIISIMLAFALSCERIDQIEDLINSSSHFTESNGYEIEVEEYGGDSVECIHGGYDSDYHKFSSLMAYVGYEEFNEWVKNIENICREQNNPDCLYYLSNFVQLIKDFNIPREKLEYLMKTTLLYYKDCNLDVIYSRDDKLIEQYYTTPYYEKEELMTKLAEYRVKWCLLDYSGENINFYAGDGIRQFNIVSFVKDNNVSKEEFIRLITLGLYAYDEYKNFQYNTDLIYSNDPRLDYMIEQGIDAAVIDSMYLTNDGIFRDDLIYEKTVEAINSGRDISIYEINEIIKADKNLVIDEASKFDHEKSITETTYEIEA